MPALWAEMEEVMTDEELAHGRDEHEAWQRVVRHWNGDINDKASNPLVRAICLWGEELAQLRKVQIPEVAARALGEAHAGYWAEVGGEENEEE